RTLEGERLAVGEQLRHRDHSHAVRAACGEESVALRGEPRVRHREQSRDRGPVEISVEHAHRPPTAGERPGEVRRDEALADPALAAHDCDDPADGAQAIRQAAALSGDLLAEPGAVGLRQLVVGPDIEWHSPGIMPSFSAPGY